MTSKLTIRKNDDGKHDIRVNGKSFIELGLLVTEFNLYFDAEDELPRATIDVVFIEADVDTEITHG